ncbi:hypothetical protein Leryth_016877 [Lithospermum erythrorhizon]|nr:hypothetical protein Leryth_016877 [Lithospermum erythrorhizon]
MEVAEREGSGSGRRTTMEISSENSGAIRLQSDDDNEEEDNPKKKNRKKLSLTHSSTIIKGDKVSRDAVSLVCKRWLGLVSSGTIGRSFFLLNCVLDFGMGNDEEFLIIIEDEKIYDAESVVYKEVGCASNSRMRDSAETILCYRRFEGDFMDDKYGNLDS